ncbi:MAG: hypothetical protein KatS3mg104_0906 [Phycisphaerae bacterium]|jgi:hypothetical protein|nr:MAG: hypothetical protein KatS3mg104_0906 [Phycisphaerae bacterium]
MKMDDSWNRKIVLTGGPGAGKTLITRLLAERYPDQFVIVPESATQVYSELKTRWDRLDIPGRKYVQQRIYAHQIAQEDQASLAHPGKRLLLDRGTIDGAAYWPDGPEAYWKELGTTLARELARYGQVIWLETAASLGIYDGEISNPVRFESPLDAIRSGTRLLELWKDHPNLHSVGAFVHIEDKIRAVEACLGVGPGSQESSTSSFSRI